MKLFFIDVQTFSNTNNLGCEVGKRARKYHHNVLTESGWKNMVDDLDKAHGDAVKRFPRVKKKFVLDKMEFKDRNGRSYPYLSFHPESDLYSSAFNVRGILVDGIDPELKNQINRQQ